MYFREMHQLLHVGCVDKPLMTRSLYLHQMNVYKSEQVNYNQGHGGNGTPPWQRHDGTIDQNLKNVYEANSSFIIRRHQEGNVCSVYNFPLNNSFSTFEILQTADEIYDRQNNAFRLNLEFVPILVHTEIGEYRYFKLHHNQELFCLNATPLKSLTFTYATIKYYR